jgi:hypothetical protein
MLHSIILFTFKRPFNYARGTHYLLIISLKNHPLPTYLPACSAIFRHCPSGVRGRAAAAGIATVGAMMPSGVSRMDEMSVRLDGSRDGFSICDKSEVLVWRTC